MTHEQDIPSPSPFDLPKGFGIINGENNLTYLAKGSESLVYRSDGSLIKINIAEIRESALLAKICGIDFSTAHYALENSREEMQREMEERYAVYRESFGDFVIPETISREQIHLPGALIRAVVHPEQRYLFAPNQAYSFTTTIRRQEEVPALRDPNRLSLTTGYAEKAQKDMFTPQEYIAITRDLVGKKALYFNPTYDKDMFRKVQKSDKLNVLIDKAESDEDLRQEVTKFLDRLYGYTKKSSNIIDTAGIDNVIFYQDNGKWKCLMTDAFFARYPFDISAPLNLLLFERSTDEHKEPFDLNWLMNLINHVRSVNALSRSVGYPYTTALLPPYVSNTREEGIFDSLLRKLQEEYAEDPYKEKYEWQQKGTVRGSKRLVNDLVRRSGLPPLRFP